ncbi:IS200/IS605 family accessory protein TnpB-related protein [Bacillus sp. DX1.1]|uniref:IS200/IS605 family accessory protein TnpB-related protein n=1 Tax=unclassified Bacillus (in: firmicutes) TaxID=185979 RepID=UPI002570ACE1|nr:MULTISPECIES: IS200/IS605 family accessory protein TnpB-related protein [unclassified Bacillus (in: firmicutes)]MDM5154653.1 IS200/IS605 family accessory protein TnpB-related protein [Bacillus sp. DX1.1]WJE83544.1 IS200/IS605 family accessory protein TnpB-related protein [Bacillus sp. DX3.1]
MKKAYFSKRIYKRDVPYEMVDTLTKTMETFNRAKRFAFQTIVREKRWSRKMHTDSLHLVLKRKYQLNDYYANSAVQEEKALFTGLIELQKIYEKQTQEKLKKIKKKLKQERTKLTKLRKIKQSCVKGKITFPKNSRFSKNNNIISLSRKEDTFIWLNEYLFEHQYLDVQIKRIQAKIGRLTHRQYRLKQKLESYQTHIPSAVFGSKKLFRSQFTIDEFIHNHDKWKILFSRARNKQFILSGRKDAKHGNFVFQYVAQNQELWMTTSTGKLVMFPAITFPYGQEIIEEVITNQLQCKNKKKHGKPIAWSVEDYGEYYIVKCLVDVPEKLHTNYSKADGVIGVDCNLNHFAWAHVTKDGNYKGSGSLRFSMIGKSTGQITKIIEAEVIRLVDLAHQYNKPIVIEKLDTTQSRAGDRYGNKRANRMKSMFAYKKMTDAILGRADKMGVAVFQVNPAYTSISGKMKYMRKLGISIHQSAAFTIGRRGLGYKEKVPQVLQPYILKKEAHHWTHWHQLNNRFDIRTHHFYQLYHVNQPKEALQIERLDLFESEKKKLAKLFA